MATHERNSLSMIPIYIYVFIFIPIFNSFISILWYEKIRLIMLYVNKHNNMKYEICTYEIYIDIYNEKHIYYTPTLKYTQILINTEKSYWLASKKMLRCVEDSLDVLILFFVENYIWHYIWKLVVSSILMTVSQEIRTP